MIPEFPQFKPIEFSDKEEVEKLTYKFSNYSDFNFVSLWSWDIKGEMAISKLNDNLVVRFTDYLNGQPFFSFIGDKKVNDTAKELIFFSKKYYKKNLLKFIPEDIAKRLKREHFQVEIDPDAHDYVYAIDHLVNMHEWKDHSSSKSIRKFLREHPNYKVKTSSVQKIKKEDHIELFEKWAKSKNINNYLELGEYKSFIRTLDIKEDSVRVVSLFVDDVLVGFTVFEIVSGGFAISHYAKTDKTYHSKVSDVLNWEEAKILDAHGVKYFNWEQDLGLPGLRRSKEKYKPILLLKKVTVSEKKKM